MSDRQALLPNGFLDRLPDEAEREAAIGAKLQSIFSQFGYRLVNPPLLEFEETLLAEGAGQALSTNTFRLMDPVSQRMMAMRSDATAQIGRLAASRMNENQRPLRLSYIADVLRIKSTQLRPERQFRQAGCEMIGENGKAAAVEIALLALKSLHEAGVQNISIDFTAPEILKTIAKNDEKILAAAYRRDRAAFLTMGQAGKILTILDEISGPAANFAKAIKHQQFPSSINTVLVGLNDLIKDLQKALKAYGIEKDVMITVDPLEARGFEYQSFPCFTLFSKDISGELGRGGSYSSVFGEKSEKACGFTLYMDTLLRAAPERGKRKSLLVSGSTSWLEMRDLQSKGWTVIRAAEKADKSAAGKYGATHIWKNKKTEEVK